MFHKRHVYHPLHSSASAYLDYQHDVVGYETISTRNFAGLAPVTVAGNTAAPLEHQRDEGVDDGVNEGR